MADDDYLLLQVLAMLAERFMKNSGDNDGTDRPAVPRGMAFWFVGLRKRTLEGWVVLEIGTVFQD